MKQRLLKSCFLSMLLLACMQVMAQNQATVYFSSGVQRVITATDTSATVSASDVLNVLNNNGLTASNVYPAFPKFSAADTMMIVTDSTGTDTFYQMNKAKIFVINCPDTTTRNNVVAGMSALSRVVFAEANGDVGLNIVPNDPSYSSQQYSLKNATGGIYAEAAWDSYKGNPASIIAIIDWGTDVAHNDLHNKISGGDNTFVTQELGTFSHGTHTAGIAGALTNNSLGIAGVDWYARLHPKNIGNSRSDQDINQKITDAVNYNANVWTLNNSWELLSASSGKPGRYSTTVRAAFAYIYNHNRVACVSMGNNNLSFPGVPSYPAAFNAGTLAVGATDNTDAVANFSSRGAHISVSAPGVNIYSTNLNNSYALASGTSMAAPHVSGLASLLKGYNINLDNDDIEWIIRYSADDVDNPGFDNNTGYGRINAKRALSYLQSPYVLQRLTTTGGSIYSTAVGVGVTFLGVPFRVDGKYTVNRLEVRATVNIPASNCGIRVWGRGVKTTGYREEHGYCYGEGLCDVVATTTTTATLRTYVYKIHNAVTNTDTYYPRAPQNVTFAYSILYVPQSVISGPSSFCTSPSPAFSVSNIPAGNTITWSATPSGIATPNSPNNTSTTFNKGSNGIATMQVVIPNGCGAGNSVTITKPNVTVGGPPVGITASLNGGCTGAVQRWLVSATPSSYGSNWHWTVDYLGAGASIYIYSPTAASTYVDVTGGGTLKLTYTDLCGGTQTNGVTVYSTCHSLMAHTISPNPASTSVTITARTTSTQVGLTKSAIVKQGKQNSEPKIERVKVFDMQGKLLKQKLLTSPASQVQLDVHDLVPGSYFVEIYDGKITTHQTLVVIR